MSALCLVCYETWPAMDETRCPDCGWIVADGNDPDSEQLDRARHLRDVRAAIRAARKSGWPTPADLKAFGRLLRGTLSTESHEAQKELDAANAEADRVQQTDWRAYVRASDALAEAFTLFADTASTLRHHLFLVRLTRDGMAAQEYVLNAGTGRPEPSGDDTRIPWQALISGLSVTSQIRLFQLAGGVGVRPQHLFVDGIGSPTLAKTLRGAVPWDPNGERWTQVVVLNFVSGWPLIDRIARLLEKDLAATIFTIPPQGVSEQDASIMVLSDRIHEPPPGSRYPNKRTESWKELKRRADRLQKLLPGTSLYIVPITKGIRLDRERGNTVDWVFPTNVIHDPDGRATDLRAAKEERLRQEATRLLWPDRELTLIGKVIGPGTIDAMRGIARATVEFVSPAVWTPVQISTIRSATPGVMVTPVDRGPWALAPSKRSVSIMVDISWRTPGRRFLDHDAPLPLRVKVVGDVTTPWRPGLDKLKFNGPVRLAETGEFPLFRDGGIHVPGTWPRWLIVAGAVLLIVAAALFVRWIRNQRRISGYLCLLVAYGGDDGIRQERLGPYELARHRDLDIHFDRPTRQELGRTATATTEKAQAKVSRTPGLRRSQRGLIVTYSADGSPATPQRVLYNDHFLIHGVDFIHHDHSHDTDVTSCDAPVESESR